MGSYKSKEDAIKISYDCGDSFYEPKIVYMGFNKFSLFMRKRSSILKEESKGGCLFYYDCKECDNLVKERNSMMLSGEGYYCKLGFKLNKDIEHKLDGNKYFMDSYKSKEEATEVSNDCNDLFYEPNIVQMNFKKFSLFMRKKSNILK